MLQLKTHLKNNMILFCLFADSNSNCINVNNPKSGQCNSKYVKNNYLTHNSCV